MLRRRCASSASSQPGCGTVSLLRNTRYSPRASAAPSLQAAMKPPLRGARMVAQAVDLRQPRRRSRRCEPSSTTITSNARLRRMRGQRAQAGQGVRELVVAPGSRCWRAARREVGTANGANGAGVGRVQRPRGAPAAHARELQRAAAARWRASRACAGWRSRAAPGPARARARSARRPATSACRATPAEATGGRRRRTRAGAALDSPDIPHCRIPVAAQTTMPRIEDDDDDDDDRPTAAAPAGGAAC